ncbi:hypothetical protein VT84_18895 [Gemmata sp. SH-PL17]|uniref:hypothetical protein n=1 Tax=Gemmata sp. SH-PL17 TaxID=1630693 RepID=UPI0004B53DD7|nr:hypothetical protein [Gemmata sp. SH-PL17]AMV26474.1 hypothetical protein VT84_18895 [Gemmata sp. SH-PL17]
MFRRLPTFLPLTFAATVGLFVLTSFLTAQPTPPTPDSGTGVKRSQEENLKFYKTFRDQVLRLAQKWEKSDSPEDKDRAKSLRAVLKLAEERGVEKLFKELIEGLNGKNLGGSEFDSLLGKDKQLIAALNEILELLQTDDETARLKEQIRKLEEAIKAIREIKTKQENLLARTFNPKSDNDKLSKDQKDLAKSTQDLANKLAKAADPNAKGTPNAGDKQDAKSENKAEPKPGENTAENKPDTKENKSDNKEGMGGAPMDPKGGSESKPMGGMGMPMAGGDKPAPMDPKGGEAKPNGESKPMDPMAGEPKPMSGESKAQGAGKAESKPSAGQPGGEGKPMGGEGMGGMGMGQPSPGGSKSGGSPSGGSPPPQQGGKKDPAAQNVQEAVPQQQGAEEDIKKNEKTPATKKQDEAIKKLEEALKDLEARLKQLREKELAKLLANLEQRVTLMLKLQAEVKVDTENIDKTVQSLGGKPAIAEIQKSQTQADKESQIVGIAEATLKLMEGEGSAVVFAGVLKEVKGDMESVQKRLNEARVGADTQQIESDIIEQLKMMKEALKKARQDLENKPSEPKPNDPNAKKPDNKLLELLAELKLVRSLQEQVNKRTVMYNKQDPGEQAKDALIQAELNQLAARQKVLQEMLHKIATKENQ